jgi:hypothetical protein
MTTPDGRDKNDLITRMAFFEAMLAMHFFTRTALRLAFNLLFRHLNSQTGQCNPATRTLAKDLKLDRRNLQRAIAELVANGWWHVTDSRGRGNIKSYRPDYKKAFGMTPFRKMASGVTPFPGEMACEMTPFLAKNGVSDDAFSQAEMASQMTPFPGEMASSQTPPSEPVRKNHRKKELTLFLSASELTLFDEFWRLYRHRPGDPKKPARDAFAAALRAGADPAAILRGAANYARSVAQEERRFIIAAARWLREECWQEWQEPLLEKERLPGLF